TRSSATRRRRRTTPRSARRSTSRASSAPSTCRTRRRSRASSVPWTEHVRGLVIASLFALAACGDSTMPAPDGGAVDTGTPPGDGGGTFELDAAAIAPMPPVLTPCRDGWREVPGELGGV